MTVTITSSASADSLSNTPLADAGIDTYTINLVNQAQDTCNLAQIPASWTGTPVITQGATVTIKEDATVVFVGICLTDPRNAMATAHAIAYQIAGPWYWLDQIEYRQRHQRWTGAALEWVYLPECTLNQAENGTSITTGAQIEAVIDYAIAQGALIAKGTIAAGITIPWESAGPVSCADVIRRQLAWTPDHVLWIDYAPASGHPQINVTPRASMPATSVNLSDFKTTKAAIRPRYDLQLPGVEIIYNITEDDDGQTYMAVQTDTAGTHADPRALRAVIELADSTSTSAQFQEIVTSDFPVAGDPAALNWLDKAWWKQRNPALAAYADADMTLHDPVIAIEEDEDGVPLYSIGDLPRILEEGTVTPWMEAGGVKSAGVTITIQLDAIERDAVGQAVREFANRVITLKVTGTNGLTRRYSRSEFSETSEEIPEGIAAAIYAALSPLTYEGDLTVIGENPASGYRPGQLFNITGGRTEWATMAAVIQSVTRNAADGSCAITFGPAKHLGPDDLARLSRRIRARKVPFSYLPRQTGLAGDGAGALGGGRGPQNQPGVAGGGKPEKIIVETAYDPDDPPDYLAQIILDPEEINPTDAATRTDPVQVKPRLINTIEVINGQAVHAQRHILASDPEAATTPFDPDDPGGEDPGGEEDDTCDQNTHPGSEDYDTGTDATEDDDIHPGDDPDDLGDHPGGGEADENDTDHPGAEDCYTTT